MCGVHNNVGRLKMQVRKTYVRKVQTLQNNKTAHRRKEYW